MGRGKHQQRTQPKWMRKVKVGSVLRNRRGTDFRAVRAVSYYSNGDLSCVTLAIRRCSWTKRPYTVLNYVDLLYQGYELVPNVRVKLNRAQDEMFNRAVREQERVTPCEFARGLP